ncbi:MAG: hypothetical protein ACTSRP_12480 [Candidatus Helarchaeota archaeon]
MSYSLKKMKKEFEKLDKKIEEFEKLMNEEIIDKDDANLIAPLYIMKKMQIYGKYIGLKKINYRD